jgi:hypothetical protein
MPAADWVRSIRLEIRNGSSSSRAINIVHSIMTIPILPGVVVSRTVRLPGSTLVVMRWRGQAAYKRSDLTFKSFPALECILSLCS